MAVSTVFMIEDEVLLCELFNDYVTTIADVEFLGYESDGERGIERALELRPDIIVLDMRLPRVTGVEALHRLRGPLPETKIIIFTGTLKEETLRLASREGADGFVEKSHGLGELKKAIEAVMRGEQYITAGVAEILKTFRA
jgi:DNA-binding NarL/FixJ family response regulator